MSGNLNLGGYYLVNGVIYSNVTATNGTVANNGNIMTGNDLVTWSGNSNITVINNATATAGVWSFNLAPTGPNTTINATNNALVNAETLYNYPGVLQNDGMGHYYFGGGGVGNDTGLIPTLTINGTMMTYSTIGESIFVDAYPSANTTPPGYLGNVLALETAGNINDAMRTTYAANLTALLAGNVFEEGAMGYVPPALFGGNYGFSFISSSWPTLRGDGGAGTLTASQGLAMLMQGGMVREGNSTERQWFAWFTDNKGGVESYDYTMNYAPPSSGPPPNLTDPALRFAMNQPVQYAYSNQVVLYGDTAFKDTNGEASSQITLEANDAGNTALAELDIASTAADEAYGGAYNLVANGSIISSHGPGGIGVINIGGGNIYLVPGGYANTSIAATLFSSGNVYFDAGNASAPADPGVPFDVNGAAKFGSTLTVSGLLSGSNITTTGNVNGEVITVSANIDATSIANTTIYTPPSGQKFTLMSGAIASRVITAETVPAVVVLSAGATTNNVSAAQTLTTSGAGQYFPVTLATQPYQCNSTAGLTLRVTTGATATTDTIQVIVTGILSPTP
jgi:hypothetical protein